MAKKAVLWTFLIIFIAGLSVAMYYLITKAKVYNIECDINRVCYVLNSNGEKIEAETTTEEKFGKLVYSKNFTEELLTSLEKEGYGFVGWFGDSEFKNAITTQTKLNDKNIAVNKKEKTATIYGYFIPTTYSPMMYWGVGDNKVRTSSQGVAYGQTIGELTESENLKAVSATGKVFYAWYADSKFTQKLDNTTKLTFEDIRFDPIMNTFIIYAKYISTENCTLVYDNTELSNGTINYGDQLNLSTTPTKTGYDFAGWYFDKELTNEIDTESEVLLNFDTVDFDGTNFHIYAKWTPKTYTITFNAGEGTCDQESKEVAYGEVYGTLPTATKDNFRFAGWYTNISDVTTKITSDDVVTLTAETNVYAKYVETETKAFVVKKSNNVSYTIYYSTDSGSSWSQIYNDSTTTANELTYYIHNGYQWKITAEATDSTYYELTCQAEQTGEVTEDKVINLTAKGKQFTLILNTNNGIGNSQIQKVYGTLFNDLLPPTRNGYYFDGWYKEAGCTTKITEQNVFNTDTVTFVDNTATIYAKWTATQVKVNTIVIGSGKPRVTNAGVKYKLRSDGNIYSLTNGGSTKTFNGVENGTYDLYASYSTKTGLDNYINTNLKITVTNETDFTEVYVYYCPLYVRIPEEDLGVNGSNNQDVEESTDDTDKYYIVRWFLKGQQFTAEVPVNTGYHFVNWTWKDPNMDIDYGVISTTNPITYEINQRMKILPHTEKNSYTIEFNTNGGNEIASVTREYLSTLADEALPEPTRSGCVFMGWFADSGFTKPVTSESIINSTIFTTEQLTNNDSTLTLYAKWLENEVVINPKRIASDNQGVPGSYIEVKLYDEINNKFIEPSTKETGVVTFKAVPVGTYKIYASSKYSFGSAFDNTGILKQLVDSGKTIEVLQPTIDGEEINNNPDAVQISYYPLYLRGNDTDETPDEESSGITSVNQNKVRYLKGQTTTISAEVAFGYDFTGWYNNSDTLKYSEIECSITINAKTTLKAKATAKSAYLVYHNGQSELSSKSKTYNEAFVNNDLQSLNNDYAPQANAVFKGWSTKSDSIADEDIIATTTLFNSNKITFTTDNQGNISGHVYAAWITKCEFKAGETVVAEIPTSNTTCNAIYISASLVDKKGYNFLGFKLNKGDADCLATKSAFSNGMYKCDFRVNVTGYTNASGVWTCFDKEFVNVYPVYEAKTTTITATDDINGEYTLTIKYGESTIKQGNSDFSGISGCNLVYQDTSTSTTSIIIGTDGKLKDGNSFTAKVDGVVVWDYEGPTLTLQIQSVS